MSIISDTVLYHHLMTQRMLLLDHPRPRSLPSIDTQTHLLMSHQVIVTAGIGCPLIV